MARIPHLVNISGHLVSVGQIEVSTLPFVESGVTFTSGIISAGDADHGDTLFSGAFLDDRGTAIGTVLHGGQVQVFGRASGTVLFSGGYQAVSGFASGTVVEAGGLDIVFSGGSETGATVSGNAQVYAGGVMEAATVYAGGNLHVGLIGVGDGGEASGTEIKSGSRRAGVTRPAAPELTCLARKAA